jgi:endonuclease/exonuclease/phosphatase family metal-dependent hydrolase
MRLPIRQLFSIRPGSIAVVCIAIFLIAIPCSHALVQPRGSDSTFDLVTWNVHEFPGSGFRTIDTLAILINDLNVDMIALQEIADTNAFYDLVNNHLPGWAGCFAPYDYPSFPYLKTAVLWRTDRATVTSLEQLFVGYEYQFPRPPIHVQASVSFGGQQFDFNLVVLHLKAESDPDSQLRRRAAVIMLKAYLDNNIPNAPDSDWIVAGDWNDELDDPQSDNVFWPLLADSTHYRFLTLPLAGNPYWASYPSFGSLIDHIMISRYADDDYGDGTTITLRLDDEYSNYRNRISDHRPVLSRFIGVQTSIDEGDTDLPERYEVLSVYPNPFNGKALLCFSLTSVTDIRLEVFDLLGRRVAALLEDRLAAGRYSIPVDAGNWPSGVYFARLQAAEAAWTAKLLHLK